MAKPWWTRIGNPDAAIQRAAAPLNDTRLRFVTSARAAGVFQAHPEVIAAFVNSKAPFAIAQRTMAEFSSVMADKQEQLFGAAGISAQNRPQGLTGQQQAKTQLQKQEAELKAASVVKTPSAFAPDADLGDDRANINKPITDDMNKVLRAGEDAFSWVGDRLSDLGSIVTSPLAAGAAQPDTALDRGLQSMAGPAPAFLGLNAGTDPKEFAQRLKRGELSTDAGVGDAILGAPVRAAGAVAETAVDFARGLGVLSGIEDPSSAQSGDMRRAGYDPDSWTSRYGYYYTYMNDRRSPVSDTQMDKAKAKFNPEDVDAAREIITSGYLADPVRGEAALSIQAKNLVGRLSVKGQDPEAERMFAQLQDNSELSFGGKLMNQMGAEYGTVGRAVGAGIADLALFWFADPVVLAAKGTKALRYQTWGVSANNLDAVTGALAASKADDFAPNGAVARKFDDTIRKVDQIYLLQNAGDEKSLAQASQLSEQFFRVNPSMTGVFDTLMAMRSGAVTKLTLRENEALLRESQRATDSMTTVQPFMYKADPSGKGAPSWQLTSKLGDKVSAQKSAEVRAQLANDIGDFIMHEAISSGRPIYRGKMLLPGQVALNRKVRDAVAPVINALNGTDRKFFRMLEETKPTRITGEDALADALGRSERMLGKSATEWVSSEYAHGIQRSFGRAWKYFEKAFSNKRLVWDSPEAVEGYRRWVTQFLPKRQAYTMVNEFALSNPAGRAALMRETVVSSLNGAGLADTPAARRMAEKMLKGLAPESAVAGNARQAGNLEFYTNPERNTIRIGEYDYAAGVHGYQLSEGMTLPTIREVRRNLEKASVLGYISGVLNNDTADAFTSVWKSSKVSTPTNMIRQAMEGFGLEAYQGQMPSGYRAARQELKLKNISDRLDKNDVQRIGRDLNQVADVEDLLKLKQAGAPGSEGYNAALRSILESHGVKGKHLDVIDRMNQSVDLAGYAPGFWTKQRLAMAGVVDTVRRIRTKNFDNTDRVLQSPYAKFLDEMVAKQLTETSLKQVGAAADNYALLNENSTLERLQDITDGVGKGFGFKPVRVPNTYQWLGEQADISAAKWLDSLAAIQADPLSSLVLQRIAAEPVAKTASMKRYQDAVDAAKAAPAEKFTVGKLRSVAGSLGVSGRSKMTREQLINAINDVDPEALATPLQRIGAVPDYSKAGTIHFRKLSLSKDPVNAARYELENITDPATYARYLISQDPTGEVIRTSSMRANYLPNGQRAVSPEDLELARGRAADDIVSDIVERLGGRRLDDGEIVFDDALLPVLDKLANGQKLTAKDLAHIPEELKPEGVIDRIYIPDVGNTTGAKAKSVIINLASKAYTGMVARPLETMVSSPLFIAHRRQAYDDLAPVMDQLAARGMSPQNAAFFIESAANRRALSQVFSSMDNPSEHSVFAEMSENFLMFNRAQEDFLRRFISATSFDPSRLARTKLLYDTAYHTGMIYNERSVNEDGQEEFHSTFVYPGSQAAVRVLVDAAAALGLAPDDVVKYPVFNGLSSQVRFLNPSLANPVTFSANPMIGLPFQAIRALFPETTADVDGILTALSGGESRFGQQDAIDQWTPAIFSRLLPLFNKDDADGAYQSAVRSAMVYAEAAGVLPEKGASPQEVQAAQDTLRAITTNVMIQRAVFGAFAPAAPALGEPGTFENNILAQAEGIQNMKGEWFALLEDTTRRFQDPSRALSEAHVEWARRYPKGKLIANASAFTVGTTQMKGSEETASSSIPATQWMIQNKDWVEENRAIAFNLLNTLGEKTWFDSNSYRLQLRLDLREHKDLASFYADVSLSDEIQAFYSQLKAFEQAKWMEPGRKEQLTTMFDQWKGKWEIAHPAAAAELDRRRDPNFVHSELAPALGRSVTQPLPKELEPVRPQLQQMYQDYRTYREAFTKAGTYDKASVNGRYRDSGDAKWSNTPLESLWKAIGVYEAR